MRVRAALVMLFLSVAAVLSFVGAWAVVPTASSAEPRRVPAILAVRATAATANRVDSPARVELPWLLRGDTGATVSPDGRLLAFSSARGGSSEIYIADTRSGSLRRLTTNRAADDVEPSWSPDSRMLVWSSGPSGSRDLFLMNADGHRKRRVVTGSPNDVEPSWSPDGTSIAFASNRSGRYQLWMVDLVGGEPTLIVDAPGRMRAPAWSPSGGAVAYTGSIDGNADVWKTRLDGMPPVRLTRAAGFDGRPDWSPDGKSMVFVSTRDGSQRLWVMRADGKGQRSLVQSEAGDDTPRWDLVGDAISPDPSALLPDLDQQAPSGLLVMRAAGKTLLGFTSAVDNLGVGPIHIRGTRLGSQRTMRADQVVHRRDGAVRIVADVGRLAYEAHPPHHHWHLEPYESYELHHASDEAVLRRDGKSGFCLLDRWGFASRRPGIVPGPPKFVGDCGARDRDARRVDEGSSVGYTDRYPGFFHGQDIDITGLSPGLYVLVHRANPERRIRELRYSNNAASLAIRISAPDVLTGVPAVTIVRRCPGSDRCVPR